MFNNNKFYNFEGDNIETPIEYLVLNNRGYNILLKYNIDTIEKLNGLINLTIVPFKMIVKRLGSKSYYDIINKFNLHIKKYELCECNIYDKNHELFKAIINQCKWEK